MIDKIPMVLAAGTHAYLCGPPPMIDSAVALLKLHGVPAEYIHADRFTTLQDAVAVAA